MIRMYFAILVGAVVGWFLGGFAAVVIAGILALAPLPALLAGFVFGLAGVSLGAIVGELVAERLYR